MDSQELTFGLPSGSPSVYLDTSHSDVVDATASELSLYIPGGDFLLEASYERLGPDLLLVGGEYSVLVKGYFTHERAPDLYTTDGTSFVPGSEAIRLAGPATPGQFAQAGAIPREAVIGVVVSDDEMPRPERRLERESDEGEGPGVIAVAAETINRLTLADLDAMQRTLDVTVLPDGSESMSAEFSGEEYFALGPGVSGEFVVFADEIFQQALNEGTSLEEAEFRVQQGIREVIDEGAPPEGDRLPFRDSMEEWYELQESMSLEEEGLIAYERAVKDWFRFSGEYEYTPVDVDFQLESQPSPDFAVLNGYVPEALGERGDSRDDPFVPLPTVVDFNYNQEQNITVAEEAGTLSLPVTRTGRIDVTTTVEFATSDGSATAGLDYTATSGTLTFAPGETTKEITVTILDDVAQESDETFIITVFNASNASLLGGIATVTIVDTDSAPTFSIDDVTTDGESAANATFTVTRGGDTTVTSTVDFASSDGTATAGADYTATSGTLTFAPGDTTKTFAVRVLADTTDESNETATLTLSNASNGSIIDATGILTITDDDTDGDPTVSSFSPADNEYSVTASDNVVITFSEAVFDNGGNIRLFKKQGDTEVTSDVTVSGTTVTINPSSDLSENTGYYVKIASNALVDEAGNSFAGFTTENTLNFTTAVFDGLEDGVNLSPTTDLLHTDFKSISIFTTPIQQGQSITYDPNDGFGNWFYFYEGTSALSGDIGTGLYNFLETQGRTEINGIPKADVGITWVNGGQDDPDGNTSLSPSTPSNKPLFKHVNLTTFNADGTSRVDWDVGNNGDNTRLVRWEYTSDGFLEGYDLRDDPEFVRAKSDTAFTPEAGNTGFLYLAFANKNSAEHDTPMTYSVAAIVDGVVEGLEYFTTSGFTGLTDENGQFRYLNGDDITFKVGGVVLGTATAEDVASGKTFLQDIADVDRTDLNDEYLENMATFLQSLDENRHPDDGIVITEATRMALQGANLDLRTATGTEVRTLVEDIGARYVNEADAMAHVKKMLVQHTGLQMDDFEEHVTDDTVIEIFDYVVTTPDASDFINLSTSTIDLGHGVAEELASAAGDNFAALTVGGSVFPVASTDTPSLDYEVLPENYMLLNDIESANAVVM